MAKTAAAPAEPATPAAPGMMEIDEAPFGGFEGEDPTPPPKKSDAEPDGNKSPDELAEARREIADLRRRNEELSGSERYWADRAQGKLPADGEGSDDEDDEPPIVGKGGEEPLAEDPDEFLDELSKKGPAAIAAALEKRGYVKKQDVAKLARQIAEQVVEKRAGKMVADTKLVSQYPELQDENSALFKATAPIYRKLVELDPKLKTSQATLFLAAEQAKLQLQLQSRKERGNGDYREEPDERAARIRGQQAPTGRGRSAPLEDEDDELGPAQRDVINLFARAGVDEKSYRQERSGMRRR